MGLIIGQGTKSGGGGGDVRLETNHNATIETNGTHVVTPNEGYDGMRKATITVDVEAADPTDKALVANATQYGLSHNLYKVMEEVKKDPRTQGYAAIMLCQYYKGYNSLSLEGGADAFLTSDGDFYVGNTTHYWHDTNDTMFDRWVAMLFASERGNYTCSNASICPRAALIDGTMGDINITATNMRFAWIDVTEDSSYNRVVTSSTNNIVQWNRQLVLRGARNTTGANGKLVNLNGATSAIIGVKTISTYGYTDSSNALMQIEFTDTTTISASGCLMAVQSSIGNTGVQEIRCPMLKRADTSLFENVNGSSTNCVNIRYLKCPQLTYLPQLSNTTNTTYFASLVHIEVGQGFNSNFNLKMCTFANCILTDSNTLVEDVTAHPTWSNIDQFLYNFEHLIVDKLTDLSGQTAKTITLAAAPYAAITESIRQKMSAKNWNLASA